MSGEPLTSRYLHSKAVRNGFPASGTFELTRDCNFSCKMCYIHDTDVSHDENLSAEQWLQIAEDAKNAGTLFLLLTGGEPFMRRDFAYIYERLIKMGFAVSINTNLSLLTQELFELFKSLPPMRMNVSLYAVSEDSYEALCGVRAFEKVKENILRLKREGISVRLNCSVSKYNIDQLDALYSFAADNSLILKAATYMYPPVRKNGCTGENDARLSASRAGDGAFDIKLKTAAAEKLAATAENILKLEQSGCIDPEALGDGVLCRAGRGAFWITYDGFMLPCGMMETPRISLNEHSFENCWRYITKKTALIRMPAECVSCKDRSICSVCAASSYAETGSFTRTPRYLCEMTRRVKQRYLEYLKEQSNEAE